MNTPSCKPTQEILLQIGRIVYINYGSLSQQLCIIRDFINVKKVIVDSPCKNFKPQVISTKRLEPTKYLLTGFTKDTDIRTVA